MDNIFVHYTQASRSISVCEMWGVRVGIQVFKRELHTHIHLDYAKVEILSYKKNKKIKINGM